MLSYRRIFSLWLLLSLTSLTGAQVLVYTGHDLAVKYAGSDSRKINSPLTLIIDLSPDRDPLNFITVVILEHRDSGPDLACQNLTQEFRLLQAIGNKAVPQVVITMYYHSEPDEDEFSSEGEFMLFNGAHKSVKLGKGQPTIKFATLITGPRVRWNEDGDHTEFEKGGVTFRLHPKETVVANAPDALGATPGFVVTVSRQVALMAKKYKVPEASVHTCD